MLKRVGDHLSDLNRELEEHRALLEARIAERTSELQEAQARVIHQENRGLTRALIRGCLEARAPYIARHDSGEGVARYMVFQVGK